MVFDHPKGFLLPFNREILLGIHLAGGAVGGCLSDFGDGGLGDLGRAVGPVGSDEGGDICNISILDRWVHSEPGHKGLRGKLLTIDHDGAGQSVKEDFNKTLLASGDPVGPVELWSEVVESATVLSVATNASCGGAVKFLAAFE